MNTSARRPAPACRPRRPLTARLLAVSLLAAGTAGPGRAASADTPLAAGPVIEIESSLSRQIPNDQMRVVLATESRGQKIDELNAQVLKTINHALQAARNIEGVKASAGSINTQPDWGKQGERTGWQVRGTLELQGSDTSAISKLAGQLATSLQLDGVSYQVSDERRLQEENRLIEPLAQAFRARAAATAKAFGHQDYRILNIQMHGKQRSDTESGIYMRSMAAEAAAPALPTDSGTSSISLHARGTIELR
ncbi:MAG: SIMPL domain-containing protein [Lautropia sp.]|nr:SIMPL domain-containing protein [Lautropia sp.]